MSDLKPCPFCGCLRVQVWTVAAGNRRVECEECAACGPEHDADGIKWNTRADSLALAAAVQAEREAIKEMIVRQHKVNVPDEQFRSGVHFACENLHAMIRSRGPAPAVDVMAVVRRLVKAWDAEHKRPITDDEWVAGYREVCACIVALRALVSPTTEEGKDAK